MKNFNKHYIIDEGMVYLIGDILDDTKNVISKLNEIELEGSTLIFLGNSLVENSEELINYLVEKNIVSYFIRGNCPDAFTKKNNFHYITEPCEIDIFGNKGLIIPNLIGHDDEPVLPWDYTDYGENRKRVDFVIGHGGPVLADFFKTDKKYHQDYLKHGMFTDERKHEQNVYRKILQRYRPRRWYCGHYQMSRQTKFVWDNWSDDGVINLRILDKGEISRIA